MVGSMFAPVNLESRNEAGATLETSQTVVANRAERETWREPDHAAFSMNVDIREAHEEPPSHERRFEPLVAMPADVNTPRTPGEEIKPASLPGTKRETLANLAFTPLMPVGEQHTGALAKPSAAAPQRRATNTGSTQTRPREPDEIQIHIGRVEVLAVPQTRAPVIPKTQRKATNLDEYLRRRDGRSS
jgi:hypothetical protein